MLGVVCVLGNNLALFAQHCLELVVCPLSAVDRPSAPEAFWEPVVSFVLLPHLSRRSVMAPSWGVPFVTPT